MKIAFVGGFAFSPKGTMRARAHPLAAELVRLGHEVTMFLTPYDNLNDSGREWMQSGVRIRNLKTGSTPLSYPRLLVELWKAIDEYRPELIHIFKPKGFAGAVGRYLVMKGTRSLAVDCDDWEGWGGWNDVKPYPWVVKEFIDRQERWMMRRAPAITVASRALNDRVASVRGSRDGVYYVPNGVAAPEVNSAQAAMRSHSQAEVRQAFNLPMGPLIFYGGHFEAGEDAMFFCRAADPVAERQGASIVFVGDGPEINKVREFFSTRPHAKVYLFPRLPYEQFLQVVGAADVAAFPYPDDALHRSKCSARVIDYMTMGKAIVTSAIGQNQEYLVDGESGMLAVPGDESAFAKKLEQLLQNSDLRARLGRQAEQRIRERFSWCGEPLQQCLAAYDQIATKS
jgi:glycosyltransferase involved in cell wall biosynthesis